MNRRRPPPSEEREGRWMRSDRVTVTHRGSGAHALRRGLECPASVFYLINTPLPKGVRGEEGEGLPPRLPRPPLVEVVGMY